MKIDYFHTLAAVLRTGSLAAASQQINITPSAVSMQMKLMEQYFGAPLFDRSGPHVRPTPLALTLAASMAPALAEIERLRRREQVAVEATLRVGVIDSLQPTLMPAILSLARERYPTLDLRPQRGRSAELTAAVKAGALDAAIVAQPERGGTQRLAWRPLFRTPLIVIAPTSSPETDLHALFAQHEWIRFDRDSITGRLATRFAQRHKLRTHGGIELHSAQSVFAMVSAGLGVSMLTAPDPRLFMGYPVRTLELGPLGPVMQMSLVLRLADAERRAMLALCEVCNDAVPRPAAAPKPRSTAANRRSLR